MARRLYYYPNGDGRLVTIDLPRVSQLHELAAERERVSRRRGDGGVTVAWGQSRRRVRVVAERGFYGPASADAAVLRQLEHLEDHLTRGGLVGFSADSDKTYASWGSAAYSTRSYIHVATGNGFSAWEGSAVLASGDEVIVESVQPQGYRSRHAITSWTAGLVTLSGSTIPQDMIGVMVRYRDFYPALRLPDDQLNKPILSTENRLVYTLDVELEVAPEIVAAGFEDLYDVEPAKFSLGGPSTPVNAGASLESVTRLGRVGGPSSTARGF